MLGTDPALAHHRSVVFCPAAVEDSTSHCLCDSGLSTVRENVISNFAPSVFGFGLAASLSRTRFDCYEYAVDVWSLRFVSGCGTVNVDWMRS